MYSYYFDTSENHYFTKEVCKRKPTGKLKAIINPLLAIIHLSYAVSIMYLSSIPSWPSSLSRKHLPSLNHQPCRPAPSLKWCFPLSLCPLCLCRKGMGHLDHKAIDLAPNSYRSLCTRHSLHLGKGESEETSSKGRSRGYRWRCRIRRTNKSERLMSDLEATTAKNFHIHWSSSPYKILSVTVGR